MNQEQTLGNLNCIDFFPYDVNAALLALDYLDSLPRGKAAGLRKISAHTGVTGTRMHAIMKTLHHIGCVGFSIEDRAGYYTTGSYPDKTLGQLIFALNRDIRINGKNYKDPHVNIDSLSEGACAAMWHVRTLVLAALEIPLRDIFSSARKGAEIPGEQLTVLRLPAEAISYASA